MRNINKVIVLVLILVTLFNIRVYAHGGNITGWNNKNSTEITEYNGKYYGYHKQNKVRHYHQVEWNEEEQKWQIIKTAVYYDEHFNIINTINNSNTTKIEVKYSKSVDGDTAKFELDGKEITVRFLGIDTPETVHPTKGEEPYGKEASNYTKGKLENAHKIEIEYDENASETDKYERPLVWVWVDDTLLQEELISNGLARTYMLQDNYKYAWMLQENEEKAKEEKVGIWSEEAKTQENVIVENIESEDNTTGFAGLIVIVISLIVAILFGKIKQKNKRDKK
ncbi:MAG: thermonuclease family protein [Clostridia bacterium]